MKNEDLREECLSGSHKNPNTAIREIRILCKNLVAPSTEKTGPEESINDLVNTVKLSGKIESHFSITGAPGNDCVLNVFIPV